MFRGIFNLPIRGTLLCPDTTHETKKTFKIQVENSQAHVPNQYFPCQKEVSVLPTAAATIEWARGGVCYILIFNTSCDTMVSQITHYHFEKTRET